MSPSKKTSSSKSSRGRGKEPVKKAAGPKKPAPGRPAAKPSPAARPKAAEKPAPPAPERRPTVRKAPTAKKTAVKKAAKRAVARRREDAGPARPPEPAEAPFGGGASKLGTKFVCFKCHAKFYDLNRPQPLCPKCGANQKDRPAVTKPPRTPVPPARRAVKAMAPLLEEEEEEILPDEEADSAALDLDLADVPAEGEEILDEDLGEDLEEAGDEEEEEI